MHGNRPFIFIFGPTAVGKTDFAEKLALEISGEIINMDSVQCYTPLTIGSAKPDWKHSPVPCHLFDVLDEPRHSSVADYNERVYEKINAIRSKGKTPVLVGGSGFYLMSLLYPPTGVSLTAPQNIGSWDDLYAIDPVRAQSIHKNDQYRIDRALAIWRATGIKPSEYTPAFNPPGDFKIIFLTRDTEQLRERIAMRTHAMLKEGFLAEVQGLDVQWRKFLHEKNIIGYAQALTYLESKQTQEDYHRLVESIINKTAAYAKRQRTFWRMLQRKLALEKQSNQRISCRFDLEVFNLTLSGHDLYISQLSKKLCYNQK